MIIAIQGDKASFHDIAARQLFGTDSGRVYCASFEETFASLKNKTADHALSAIENSLYGSINEVYDLILANQFSIIGEVYLPIRQCLIGLPDAQLSDVTTVHSHPVALAQCDEFLDTHLPRAQRLEHHDTAASVALIKGLGDPSSAAIAGREAADLYGMKIIADSIETNKANYTRFVALAKTDEQRGARTKTSLVLQTEHTPGALYRALGCLAERSINLCSLHSRPIIGKAWRYMFYMDIEAGSDDPEYKAAIEALKAQGCQVTVLGSYQAATDSGADTSS